MPEASQEKQDMSPHNIGNQQQLMCASSTVFQIPELLGEILQHIPMLDFSPLRPVSHAFQDEVDRLLRKHIKQWSTPNEADSFLHWSPLHPTAMNRYTPYITQDEEKLRSAPFTYPIITWNPLLAAAHISAGNWQTETVATFDIEKLFHNLTGQWQDTFLTQPPCLEVELSFRSSDYFPSRLDDHGTKGGVRLGALHEAIVKVLKARRAKCRKDDKTVSGTFTLRIEGVVPETSRWVLGASRQAI